MITEENNEIIETIGININSNIIINQKWNIYKIGWEKWTNKITGKVGSDFFCWIYSIQNNIRCDYLITIFDKEAKLDDLKNSFVINYEVNCGEIRRKGWNFDYEKIHIFDYNEFFKCEQFTKEYQKWYFEIRQSPNLEQQLLF